MDTKSNIKKLYTIKTERVPAESVRRFRLLLLAAAVLFPAWILVLRYSAPLSDTDWPLRVAVSVLAVAIWGATYRFTLVYQHIESFIFGLALFIISVAGHQAHINHLNTDGALGYTAAAFGIALAFESQRFMLGYLGYAVLVSLVVGGPHPLTSRFLFVGVNICTLIMAGVAFHDKLYLMANLKRRYRELELNRSVLNEVQKVAKMGGWTYKIKTQTLWWSDQAYHIHELSTKTRIRLDMAFDFVAPVARSQIQTAFDAATTSGTPFNLELPVSTTQHKPIWVRITCKAESEGDTIVRLIGSIHDITAEKQMSDELVAREAYARAVIDAIPGFVSWTDADLRYVGVNKALAEAFKLTPEDFIGKPMGFKGSGRVDAIAEFMREFFAASEVALSREVTFAAAGGKPMSVLLSAKKYRQGKEAVLIGLDITARRRIESELTEQKELLAQILDHIPHGIYAKDIAANHRYVMWNKRMELMTGRPRQAVINRSDGEIYATDYADQQRQLDGKVIDSRRLYDLPEEELPTQSGTLPTHTMRVPVLNAQGEPVLVLGVYEDISEKKAREQLIHTQQMQLIHASKMSTLGEMSGGIAHEINNPLTVIMGFATRLATSVGRPDSAPEDLQRYAERIVSMTERIAKIVRGLKTFAREASHDPFDHASVHHVVHESLELCQERFLNNGVRLDLPTVDQELKVLCRPVQITQVLVNLLSNAYDAVQQLSDKWVRLEVKDLGDCVYFAVVDSGGGIPEQVAAKVLHPFFTTKPVGQGTGLGLSISRGIIESHRGNLYYDAASPNTSFVFILPKEQSQTPVKPLQLAS